MNSKTYKGQTTYSRELWYLARMVRGIKVKLPKQTSPLFDELTRVYTRYYLASTALDNLRKEYDIMEQDGNEWKELYTEEYLPWFEKLNKLVNDKVDNVSD